MEQNEVDYQISRDALPTGDEIEAVIFDMRVAEKRGLPDNSNLDEMWASEALIEPEAQGYGSAILLLKRERVHGLPLGGPNAN